MKSRGKIQTTLSASSGGYSKPNEQRKVSEFTLNVTAPPSSTSLTASEQGREIQNSLKFVHQQNFAVYQFFYDSVR